MIRRRFFASASANILTGVLLWTDFQNNLGWFSVSLLGRRIDLDGRRVGDVRGSRASRRVGSRARSFWRVDRSPTAGDNNPGAARDRNRKVRGRVRPLMAGRRMPGELASAANQVLAFGALADAADQGLSSRAGTGGRGHAWRAALSGGRIHFSVGAGRFARSVGLRRGAVQAAHALRAELIGRQAALAVIVLVLRRACAGRRRRRTERKSQRRRRNAGGAGLAFL